MTGKLNLPVVAWCYAHFEHGISKNEKKWLPLSGTKKFSPARKLVRFTMAAMARTSTLEEALEMFKHFVIIVRSPHFTADVSNSLQRLCICFGAEASSSLLVEDDNDIPDLEVNLPDEDRFCSSLLETYHDSPFYKEFK